MRQIISPTENGYGGIMVEAYDASGNSVGTATTAMDGTYTIAGVSGALRIEFTWPNPFLNPSRSGGTTVQFVNAPTNNVNLGVLASSDYCDSRNPRVVAPCY
ncbi:MAG: hypothetical protein AAF738_05655, partial [Bacteroidota bacterium]